MPKDPRLYFQFPYPDGDVYQVKLPGFHILETGINVYIPDIEKVVRISRKPSYYAEVVETDLFGDEAWLEARRFVKLPTDDVELPDYSDISFFGIAAILDACSEANVRYTILLNPQQYTMYLQGKFDELLEAVEPATRQKLRLTKNFEGKPCIELYRHGHCGC